MGKRVETTFSVYWTNVADADPPPRGLCLVQTDTGRYGVLRFVGTGGGGEEWEDQDGGSPKSTDLFDDGRVEHFALIHEHSPHMLALRARQEAGDVG